MCTLSGRVLVSVVAVVALGLLPVRALGRLVGESGDPDRLLITGCRQTPVEQVRRAICRDWPLQIASSPAASLDAYVSLLQQRLSIGYRRSGYPDASVSVTHNAARGAVQVEVREGPRYFMGDVVVEGPGEVDPALLEDALTAQPADAPFQVEARPGGAYTVVDKRGDRDDQRTKELWSSDRPAPFDPEGLAQLRKRVSEALFHQGWVAPAARVELRRQAQTADLVVHLSERGSAALVSDLVIRGLSRQPEGAVRRVIGLEAGDELTASALVGVYERLWWSGRFAAIEVRAVPDTEAQSGLVLSVRLVEQAHVPALDQPLSESQEAILRVARWLIESPARGDDVRVRLFGPDAGAVEVIGAGDRGFLLRLEKPDASAPVADVGLRVWGDLCVTAHEGRLGVLDQHSGRQWEARIHRAQIIFALVCGAVPNDPTAAGTISASAGLRSVVDEGATPPVRLVWHVDPVVFLASACKGDVQASVKEGRLEVHRVDGWHLVANAETGELAELHVGSDDGSAYAIEVGPGLFDKALAAAERQVAQRQQAEMHEGIDAGLAMLLEMPAVQAMYVDAGATPRQRLLAAGALRKLLAQNVVEPIDTWVSAREPARPDAFTIPIDHEAMSQQVSRRGAASLALMGLFVADEAWERGSWPWALTRLGLLTVAGMPEPARAEMVHLYADQTSGPLGCLASAAFIRYLDPGLASLFAEAGLDRLNEARFEDDLQALTGDGGVLSEVGRRLMLSVAELTPEEAAALAGAFTASDRALAIQMHSGLRRAVAESDDIDAGDAAAQWYPLLRAHLTEALERLSSKSGAPSAPR